MKRGINVESMEGSCDPIQTAKARRLAVGFLLGFLFCVGPTCADTIRETEPNNAPATANATVGLNDLAVIGAIDSTTDQDYFTFLVAKEGVPIPPFSTAVRIAFTQSPHNFSLELTHESGTTIFSGIFAGPSVFDFNANVIGGVGRYTLRLGAAAPTVGTYVFSIVGVADGAGAVPPTVRGTADVAPSAMAESVPTVSGIALLLMILSLIVIASRVRSAS